MSMVDGGELFGRALKNEGVETAFVLCGGHIMPIFYGMRNAGIEIIDMRHEAAAMYAATAYYRASGKPAVVVTTAGPGVENTPAGMMEAGDLGIPLVQIGGAVGVNQRDAGHLQDMSTLSLMESCSKWARKITSTERIPEYVSMAFRHAMDSSPGPVYLEIPTDLCYAQVEENTINFPVNCRADTIPWGDAAAVDAAATLLANAERPAMVIGDGARAGMGEHAGAVAGLSDYLKMPTDVTGLLCRGLFGDESENPLLTTNALSQADVVLAMGCRFDLMVGFGMGIPADAKVIQVHTNMTEIGFNLRADVAIVGGPGPVAGQILEAIKAKQDKKEGEPWSGPLQKGPRPLDNPGYTAEGVPMHPARCAGEVAKFLAEEGSDWNVAFDGGESSIWMRGTLTARRPGQLHASGGNGAIGTGPCLAVGAWAANRKPVLWYTGDGSFGYYAMEMDTMAKQGMPVVCVISNDSAWGMIKLTESFVRPEEVAEKGHCNVDLNHMLPYEYMAAMWGGHGEMVTDPEEIVPAIKRAAANGKPSIINVEVDKESMTSVVANYAAFLQGSN